MTLTRLTLATVILTTLTITACATMQVNSYVEGGADVTRYRTYEWAPPDTQATGDPRLDNNEFFRGRIQSQEDRGGTQIINARVPLSEMFGYATDLRSRTQGRATYSMHFDRYEQAPQNVSEEVVARMQGTK